MALEQVSADSPLRAELAEIRKAAQRSARLTNQLLAFARRQMATPVRLELNGTIEAKVILLRRFVGKGSDWDFPRSMALSSRTGDSSAFSVNPAREADSTSFFLAAHPTSVGDDPASSLLAGVFGGLGDTAGDGDFCREWRPAIKTDWTQGLFVQCRLPTAGRPRTFRLLRLCPVAE